MILHNHYYSFYSQQFQDEAIKIPRSVVSNVAASYGSGETRIPNIDGGTDGTIR